MLPPEVIERDYGCGDPTRWINSGESVLDLGCGTGKVCYIAAQIVGPLGRVVGVDRNDEMLTVARRHQPQIGERLGYQNTSFFKGSIQDLALDLDRWDEYLRGHPIASANDWLRAEAKADELRRGQPMVADASIDVVVSNCVLNLVRESDRRQLFGELFRVLKPGGRAVISDIVADRPVPRLLKDDPRLWSGCVSGAFVEGEFLAAFAAAGFEPVQVVERQPEPWTIVEQIEFRSVTVRAQKPSQPKPLRRRTRGASRNRLLRHVTRAGGFIPPGSHRRDHTAGITPRITPPGRARRLANRPTRQTGMSPKKPPAKSLDVFGVLRQHVSQRAVMPAVRLDEQPRWISELLMPRDGDQRPAAGAIERMGAAATARTVDSG